MVSTHTCLLKFGVAIVITLTLLHFLLVPNLIRYYNDDCTISTTRYEAYKLLFQRIVTSYNKLNQTYWVDHGLLLGYYRHGDILPHDGDVDLDRIHMKGGEKHFDENFQKLMSNFPETLGNAIVAEMNYTGEDGERVYVTADLFRMSVVEEKDKKTVQYFWNKGHREDKRYQLFEKHFENVFPFEDIFPLKRRMFLGVNASFPNNIPAILRRRYGPLYRIPIPYKWKCYINTTSMTIFLLLVLLISSLFVCIRTCRQYLKYEENLVKLRDKSAVGLLVHRMKFAPERGWPWSSIRQGIWTFARCFNMMVPLRY